MSDWDAFQQEVFGWQEERFPNDDVVAKLTYMMGEVGEILDRPDDIFEWADVLIFFLGASKKAGFTIEEVLAAARRKLEINRTRKWGGE